MSKKRSHENLRYLPKDNLVAQDNYFLTIILFFTLYLQNL